MLIAGNRVLVPQTPGNCMLQDAAASYGKLLTSHPAPSTGQEPPDAAGPALRLPASAWPCCWAECQTRRLSL